MKSQVFMHQRIYRVVAICHVAYIRQLSRIQTARVDARSLNAALSIGLNSALVDDNVLL